MAKETAEQKLLRLIEQGGTDGSTGAPSASGAALTAQQTLNAVQSVGGTFAIPGFLGRGLAWVKALGVSALPKTFGIREMNKMLVVAVVVMTVIFLTNMTRGMHTAQQDVAFKEPTMVQAAAEIFLPKVADVQRYLSAVSLRNIFNPFEKKEEVAEVVPSPVFVATGKVAERTKALKLVGISWLDTPDSASAMVENTNSGVTFFLRAGEKVNEVTVESIYADSIVLEYEGQRMELRL